MYERSDVVCRHNWTSEETDALLDGVARHGLEFNTILDNKKCLHSYISVSQMEKRWNELTETPDNSVVVCVCYPSHYNVNYLN